MTAPLTPIPRSPAMGFKTIESDDGTEWCLNTNTAKGNEMKEPEIDWVEQMDRLAERDALRKQAEAQEKWIQEYRAKIFRNVHDYPKAKK